MHQNAFGGYGKALPGLSGSALPQTLATRRAALRSVGDVGEGLPLRNRAWKQGEEREYKGGKREERRGRGGSPLQRQTWIDGNGH